MREALLSILMAVPFVAVGQPKDKDCADFSARLAAAAGAALYLV